MEKFPTKGLFICYRSSQIRLSIADLENLSTKLAKLVRKYDEE